MKNKVFSLILLAFLAFNFSNCKGKDPMEVVATKADVNLTFKATFNDQPFEANKKYVYKDGKKAYFSLYQFFVSDVELVKADGSATPIIDVDFVNLTFSNLAEAEKGQTIVANNVPTGEYTGVRFGVGVSPDLNSKNPNSLPNTNPLTVNSGGEFWVGWQSYIFMKIEGRFDENGDDSIYEVPFLYHCGSNAVYRTVTFPQPISIKATGTNNISFSSDIAKILLENNQPFDIKLSPFTSDDPSDVIVATKLVSNFQSAFKAN
jgi:hypothetical protein